MGIPTCFVHVDEKAIASCRICFRPLCNVCLTCEDLGPRCADCLRRERRSNRIVRSVIALLVVGAVGIGAYFVKTNDERSDYGEHAGEVRQLAAQLQKEPCDRRKILMLTELMLSAGDARGALKWADGFLQRCGDYPRLRWITMESHKQLSEWDQAAAEATRLIDGSPYESDFHSWRGLIYEQKGDWGRAVGDFRQAIALRPRLSDIPFNLADAYEHMGKPCDAVFPLEQVLYYYPDVRNRAEIRSRISGLTDRGGCTEWAGQGRAQIPITPGASILRVKAQIESREQGLFVVDTGASYVSLSLAFAKRLGLDLRNAPTVLIQSANGKQTGYVVTLQQIDVQGVKAARVPAVVVEDLGEDIDGLLGLSFLLRFDLKQTDGMLEITARHREPDKQRPRLQDARQTSEVAP